MFFVFCRLRQLDYIIMFVFICQDVSFDFYNLFSQAHLRAKESAEGGIRTHAPLRTNGFQDRLVMTTSIPLRIVARERLELSTSRV